MSYSHHPLDGNKSTQTRLFKHLCRFFLLRLNNIIYRILPFQIIIILVCLIIYWAGSHNVGEPQVLLFLWGNLVILLIVTNCKISKWTKGLLYLITVIDADTGVMCQYCIISYCSKLFWVTKMLHHCWDHDQQGQYQCNSKKSEIQWFHCYSTNAKHYKKMETV